MIGIIRPGAAVEVIDLTALSGIAEVRGLVAAAAASVVEYYFVPAACDLVRINIILNKCHLYARPSRVVSGVVCPHIAVDAAPAVVELDVNRVSGRRQSARGANDHRGKYKRQT